jgi:hydrogenase maturation protease
MQATSVKKTAVLGFGNPVRADDGVGIYVVDQLKARIATSEQLSIFDMGTAAFEVLFQLKGHERIILVDAVVNAEEPVGTVFRLPASAVEAEVEDDPLVFLHGLKWHQALSYARKMLGDDYPEEIIVYLVAIEDTRFNVGMTEAAKAGGDKVVEHLLAALKDMD